MFKEVPDRDKAPLYLQSYEFNAGKTGPAEARQQVELTRADQV